MDEEEFDALYASCFQRLTGQVYALCGDRAEAADCVQEAFIKAWDRRADFDRTSSPEAWLRTVAYRLAVSRWRRFGRQRHELTFDVASHEQPNPDRVALQRALAELPAKHRQAVVLHYLADLSVADVALEMGAPEGSVKVWLSRGRQKLAGLLTEQPLEVSHA